MKPISRELAMELAPRIMKRIKVNTKTGCWHRTVNINPGTGYSSIAKTVQGKTTYYLVHRVMYVFMNGPIPEGLTIDHLCEVVECCNPSHMQAVTQRVNVLRSRTNPAALNARKEFCDNGHPFIEVGGNKRRCATCARVAAKRRRKERQELGVPADESHGTRRAYHYWVCRCDECRAWKRNSRAGGAA